MDEAGRGLIAIVAWMALTETTRKLVLARIARRTISPLAGAILLSIAASLLPWIAILVGAIRPAVGSALIISLPAGLISAIMFYRSFRRSA
jgi:hypothetical protein